MPGVDSEFGASILRLWLAAGSAILLILFCVLALFQAQLRLTSSPVRRVGFVVIGAILGCVMTWGFLDHSAPVGRAAERPAFELRAEQLNAQAMAPGSPLACLDALAGESVEAACEKSLFASPASVASAASYAAAKLTLLAGITAYVQHGGTELDDLSAQLRRSLEADRYGFVAHVLAVRDHCTSENCKPLGLLKDATLVRANLAADKLGRYLEHYAAAWSATPEVAEAAPSPPSHKPVNIDFPTAASIPPVNIMNPEPSGPVLPGAAAAAAANPNPPAAGAGSSTRHARKQAPNNAPGNTAAVAAPLPAPAPGGSVVEPIWPEPIPPAPQATPNPQASPAPAAPAAPVQITPSSASAGAAARTQ
jgi:hypothetical protein